jgi:hypothetical protein
VTNPITAPPRPVDGRRDRWNEHRARRRAVLVDAGVATIDTYGSESSAEDIAATAEVSRTVLYRYFRDKEDLHAAIPGCTASCASAARRASRPPAPNPPWPTGSPIS